MIYYPNKDIRALIQSASKDSNNEAAHETVQKLCDMLKDWESTPISKQEFLSQIAQTILVLFCSMQATDIDPMIMAQLTEAMNDNLSIPTTQSDINLN